MAFCVGDQVVIPYWEKAAPGEVREVVLGPDPAGYYVLRDERGMFFIRLEKDMELAPTPIPDRWGYLDDGAAIGWNKREYADEFRNTRPLIRWVGEYVD